MNIPPLICGSPIGLRYIPCIDEAILGSLSSATLRPNSLKLQPIPPNKLSWSSRYVHMSGCVRCRAEGLEVEIPTCASLREPGEGA